MRVINIDCRKQTVKAPIANQGHGHAGVLGHHGGPGGRFKFAAPTLRLLALWVERQVVPPAPHANITKFEDCKLRWRNIVRPGLRPGRRLEPQIYGNAKSKKARNLERA